jgi:hypothetical protein
MKLRVKLLILYLKNQGLLFKVTIIIAKKEFLYNLPQFNKLISELLLH